MASWHASGRTRGSLAGRSRRFWGLATLGMIANVLAWLAIGVARRRGLAVTGGALAIAGFAARFVISVVIVADPRIDTDTTSVAAAIPVTIVLMFGGLALLGIATRRAHRLDGTAAWAPLLVLAGPAWSPHPSTPSTGSCTSSCSACCGAAPGCTWH